MKKNLSAILFIFLLAGVSAMAQGAAVSKIEPRVWMCKGNFAELAAVDQRTWRFVQAYCKVIKVYIDEIPKVRIEDLRKFAELCAANRIEVAVECAGLCDWRSSAGKNTAKLSFQDEFAKVKRYIKPVEEGGAGGKIKYLDMDHPITRLIYQTVNGRETKADFHTLGSASDQLVEVMKLWRDKIPDIEFCFLTNFPNYGWADYPAYHAWDFTGEGEKGYYDAKAELETVIKKTAAAGIPLKGITVDNPYDYATGQHFSNQPSVTTGVDWVQRLRDLQDFCKQNKLEFGLIFNSERAGSEGSGSDELYFKETLDFVDLYCSTGSIPDYYIIQSWYKHPSAYVPETEPYTMTNLVMEVILKLRPDVKVFK